MREYIIRRLFHTIPLIIGITLISFFIIQLSPGDYFTQMALNPEISEKTLKEMREHFGLDRPIIIQYFKWLKGVLTLNFGYSFAWKVPVFDLIRERLVNTLILSISTLIFSWLLAIPIGVYCALKPYSSLDKALSGFSFLGMSIPHFFLAFLLIFLAAKTGWFPIGGVVSLNYATLPFWGKVWNRISHLIIPVSVLTTGSLAGLVRLMRGNMLEVLRQQYIYTARAKGLKERVVVFKHALKNAINPMITIFGFELSGLLSGAGLTEIVTAWPGLGRLMLEAVMSKDLYLVMGSLFMGSLLLIFGNLVADILLAIVDPRIRYK